MKTGSFLISVIAAAILLTACGAPAAPVSALPGPEPEPAASEALPPAVMALDLAGQPEAALAQLADLPALETLDISGMKLTSAEPLKSCTGLRVLNARDTGLTPAMYEELRQILPQCEILWSVPLGSETVDCLAETVAVPADGGADLANLDYLENLTAVDLTAVAEDDLTLAYVLAHPGIDAARTVDVLGTRYDCTAEVLDLTASAVTDPDQLGFLSYLLQPVTVDLRGECRSLEEMEAFTAAYPEDTLLFSFDLSGLGIKEFPVDGAVTELDISSRKVKDPELLRRYLDQMPCLTQLVMCDCGLSNEEMALLREDYPAVKVVWMLHIRNYYSLRTDAEVFSTLAKKNEDYPSLTTKDVQVFRYCTDLKALDLGHHSIRDISFLEDLPGLRVLILALNNISDFSPLAGLQDLTYLEIFGNVNAEALEPLSGLIYLKDLNISYNELAVDYESLYGLVNLERLWMARMPATEAELAALREHLPGCTIVCEKWGFAVGDNWRVHERYDALNAMFHTRAYDPVFEPDLAAGAEAESPDADGSSNDPTDTEPHAGADEPGAEPQV